MVGIGGRYVLRRRITLLYIIGDIGTLVFLIMMGHLDNNMARTMTQENHDKFMRFRVGYCNES